MPHLWYISRLPHHHAVNGKIWLNTFNISLVCDPHKFDNFTVSFVPAACSNNPSLSCVVHLCTGTSTVTAGPFQWSTLLCCRYNVRMYLNDWLKFTPWSEWISLRKAHVHVQNWHIFKWSLAERSPSTWQHVSGLVCCPSVSWPCQYCCAAGGTHVTATCPLSPPRIV